MAAARCSRLLAASSALLAVAAVGRAQEVELVRPEVEDQIPPVMLDAGSDSQLREGVA